MMVRDTKPLYVVCGATATGKTEYALRLAKKHGGELVSADSRQLYKHLDIGTGKDLPIGAAFHDRTKLIMQPNSPYTIGYHTVDEIPIWLYDIIAPDRRFSASEFATVASAVIHNIWSRGKVPIVVGGAGFYIKALVDGADTLAIPPNDLLRSHLNTLPLPDLQHILQSKDAAKWDRMNNSDRLNPRRLIRAIEAIELQPQTIRYKAMYEITNNINFIGLSMSRDKLYKKIDVRVVDRFKLGIVDEIRTVLKKGYTWADPGLQTIGYREWQPFFEKGISTKDIVALWKQNEHQYAKRQETWFKKDKRIQWTLTG